MADGAALAELIVDTLRELNATQVEAAELRAERDVYQAIAKAGIHHAHQLQAELAQLRARYHRLLDDRRAERVAAA